MEYNRSLTGEKILYTINYHIRRYAGFLWRRRMQMKKGDAEK